MSAAANFATAKRHCHIMLQGLSLFFLSAFCVFAFLLFLCRSFIRRSSKPRLACLHVKVVFLARVSNRHHRSAEEEKTTIVIFQPHAPYSFILLLLLFSAGWLLSTSDFDDEIRIRSHQHKQTRSDNNSHNFTKVVFSVPEVRLEWKFIRGFWVARSVPENGSRRRLVFAAWRRESKKAVE